MVRDFTNKKIVGEVAPHPMIFPEHFLPFSECVKHKHRNTLSASTVGIQMSPLPVSRLQSSTAFH